MGTAVHSLYVQVNFRSNNTGRYFLLSISPFYFTALFVLQMSDISQHIDLTSSQIERLRSKFARYESPPSFYYEQQEEYTNKLQDFNVRKQMLQEQIHQVWPLAQSGGS